MCEGVGAGAEDVSVACGGGGGGGRGWLGGVGGSICETCFSHCGVVCGGDTLGCICFSHQLIVELYGGGAKA